MVRLVIKLYLIGGYRSFKNSPTNQNLSLKPPRNPTGNIANTREGVKQSSRQAIQNNIVERFQIAHRQSSSLSRLGSQNYNNMINENKEHVADQKYDQYQQNYHTAQNDQPEEDYEFEQTYVNPIRSNHLDTINSGVTSKTFRKTVNDTTTTENRTTIYTKFSDK